MLRIVGAVLAGLVVMLMTVAGVEYVGHALYPPAVDLSTPEALREAIMKMPFASLAFVVIAWTLGAFLGALVAAAVLPAHRGAAAIGIGTVMLLLVAFTVMTIPHPVWMVLAGLVLPLPAAWFGAMLIRRKPA
jgi:hypothetical protein